MTRAPRGNAGRGDWRQGQGRRRPPASGDGDGERQRPSAPSMARSRVQLATQYAPGVLFTWEGAKGICRSVPIENDVTVGAATRQLIFDGVAEIASNWFARAANIRQPDPVPIELILDDDFYNHQTGVIEPNWQQDFQLTDPGVMGYVPYPLLFRCAHCGHLEEYESIHEQAERPLPARCNGHNARWTQVDVVYVHWSGNLEPLSPFHNNIDGQGAVSAIRVCTCGGRDFRLINQSPVFSEWRFVCEGCGVSRALKQPDPRSWEVLDRVRRGGGRNYEFIETNMLPVSYRANSAFYPQKGTFIEFIDRNVVDILLPQRQNDLLQRVAEIHGVPFVGPTDGEIEATLAAAGRQNDWRNYQEMRRFAEQASAPGLAAQLREQADALRESWYAEGIINRGAVSSAALQAAVLQRSGWAKRYDPIRLTIEHDRFVAEHIVERTERHETVNVMQPDQLICDAYGDPQRMDRYRAQIGSLLTSLGVAELHLIRGLPICEFSFGYTRVSASPVYVREYNNRNVNMPVRLNAFPRMPSGRHPIYVTQQRNEALFFRLDQSRVRRWLLANGIIDLPGDDTSLGAAYVESYQDFEPFLDQFKSREGLGNPQRTLTTYSYMLLHSLAHQAMHALADASGLDRDGLGEHIFPADYSFVIYRKGMTPDLGNISAMWRNHASDFLRRMLDPRLLRCGSGTLCDTRGGACPACIMVSEVSCIAGNNLLNRATLRGGHGPLWEPQDATPLVGYFDPGLAHD